MINVYFEQEFSIGDVQLIHYVIWELLCEFLFWLFAKPLNYDKRLY